MKRKIGSLLLAMLFTPLLLTAKEKILTIDRAIELSLRHSPDIDTGRFDFEGAKARSRFQRGGYLPRLDLEATAGKQGERLKGESARNAYALIGSLSASQLLYDFGKTSGRVSASDAEAAAYKAALKQTISGKILAVKTRYYDVLKMRSIIRVNRKNIALQKEQLRRATRYYESGIRTVIDVSDARVRLRQARLDLSNAEYELELRRALLEEEMGYVPYDGHYRLRHRKLDLPRLSRQLPEINTSLPQLMHFAYAHRYELKSSRHLVARSRSLVESRKGDYLPTLSLRGDYGAQRVDRDYHPSAPEQQWQLGVDMRWNLFAGGQTDASVQEARIAAMKAASHVDRVRLKIRREVIGADLNVRRMNKAVSLSESIAKAAEKKYLQAKKRYENGLSDYIELQEAQQGYIQALSELVVAYYDYYIAVAQLDYAVGR
jgi:outer membrane protein